jgi:(p)ppGpp synthase/HD superfamily hydrolase
MMEMNLLNQALRIATIGHEGQTDRGGVNYMLHVISVMQLLDEYVVDDELRCIALLHDVVEDTDVTLNELKEFGFSDRIIAGVKAMTKVAGQSMEEYKEAIFSSVDAMHVKLADLTHNSDLSRINRKPSEGDMKRQIKYQQFIEEIAAKLY